MGRTPSILRGTLLALAIALLAGGAETAAAANVPLPPRLTVHEGTPCPDYPDGGSCSKLDSDDVYLDSPTLSDRWHETGHQFDRQVLTAADRAWLTVRLGFPAGTTWWGDWEFYVSRDLSHSVPAERFADAYAMCALGKTPASRRRGSIRVNDWTTAYGYWPTARRHRRICNAIYVIALVRA